MDLVTIGVFAKLSGLSVKALRLYDESELLVPERVDPHTGYRWYSRDQLTRARTITLLRGLDMPLATVRELLELPAPDAAEALERYWQTREQRHRGQRRLLRFLIDRFQEKRTPMYEITVRDVPTRLLLSVQEHLTAEQVPVFYTRWCRQLAALELEVSTEGRAPFLRYHGEVGADGDGPVEFCCPITDTTIVDALSAFPELVVRREPAGQEATVAVPRQDMFSPLGFETLHQWLADHGAPATPAVSQTFLRNDTDAPTEPAYELAVAVPDVSDQRCNR